MFDDLDAYLYRFERYATMQGWPKERWPSNLSALLKGSVLQVFHRMSLDDSGDYELLKIALLNRYRLTDADFRNKLRQAKPQDATPSCSAAHCDSDTFVQYCHQQKQ